MKERIYLYRYWLLVIGIVLASIIFFCFQLMNTSIDQGVGTKEDQTIVSIFSDSMEKEESINEEQLFVDVKGSVKNPGIYEVKAEMRVWDVLLLAGGMTEGADEKQMNLSQKIEDEMVIYVPKQGEILEDRAGLTANPEKEKAKGKINLNTASEQELMTLSGIGQKKALEIIKYREENDGFNSIEELMNISGIGEKTIEKLKEYITVS